MHGDADVRVRVESIGGPLKMCFSNNKLFMDSLTYAIMLCGRLRSKLPARARNLQTLEHTHTCEPQLACDCARKRHGLAIYWMLQPGTYIQMFFALLPINYDVVRVANDEEQKNNNNKNRTKKNYCKYKYENECSKLGHSWNVYFSH